MGLELPVRWLTVTAGSPFLASRLHRWRRQRQEAIPRRLLQCNGIIPPFHSFSGRKGTQVCSSSRPAKQRVQQDRRSDVGPPSSHFPPMLPSLQIDRQGRQVIATLILDGHVPAARPTAWVQPAGGQASHSQALWRTVRTQYSTLQEHNVLGAKCCLEATSTSEAFLHFQQ